MLTLMQHNTNGLPHPFPTLEALLAEPFPRTPQDMMQLPAFSANTPPAHAHEKARKSLPEAALRADAGGRSAR
jgi:hypothetical protein